MMIDSGNERKEEKERQKKEKKNDDCSKYITRLFVSERINY